MWSGIILSKFERIEP